MSEQPWIPCEHELPPEGEIVETKTRRSLRRLKCVAGTWFSPCGKLWLYYGPTHWRRSAKAPES